VRLTRPSANVHPLTKKIWVSIGVWWLALISLVLFPIHFLSWFALVLSLPISVGLVILALVALFKDKRRLWPTVSIGIVVFTVYVALAHLEHFGALANFYLHRPYYEATVRSMLNADTDSEQKQICGDGCWMMSHDPPRVAFHYIHGFLNWDEIVYDPSGVVSTPMSVDERFRMNTYFRSAKHLTGDWYLCHFSD
jgi:hypothetical protein